MRRTKFHVLLTGLVGLVLPLVFLFGLLLSASLAQAQIWGNCASPTVTAYSMSIPSGTANWNGCLGASGLSHTTGKWYFEATLTSVSTGGGNIVGLADASAAIGNGHYLGQDVHGTGCDILSGGAGRLYNAGSFNATSCTSVTGASGQILQVAVDLSNNRWWSKLTTDTNWNNTGACTPANTGCALALVIGGGSTALYPAGSVYGGTGADAAITNLGQAAFSGTVPAGFAQWWTPVARHPIIDVSDVVATAAATGGSSFTITGVSTTSFPDAIVVWVSMDATSAPPAVISSITGCGVTWPGAARFQYSSSVFGASTDQHDVEEWVGYASAALSSCTITVNLSKAHDAHAAVVYGVTNPASSIAYFDPNVSLPTNNHCVLTSGCNTGSDSTNGRWTGLWSTTNANDFLSVGVGSAGGGSANSALPCDGFGYIGNSGTTAGGNTVNVRVWGLATQAPRTGQYFSTPSAQFLNCTNNGGGFSSGGEWIMSLDAVTGGTGPPAICTNITSSPACTGTACYAITIPGGGTGSFPADCTGATNGTYTFDAIGGGGGGTGGGGPLQGVAGGGGGGCGGAWSEKTGVSITGATSYTIGGGGAGGAAGTGSSGYNAGTAGGDTYVGASCAGGSVCAKGGGGGSATGDLHSGGGPPGSAWCAQAAASSGVGTTKNSGGFGGRSTSDQNDGSGGGSPGTPSNTGCQAASGYTGNGGGGGGGTDQVGGSCTSGGGNAPGTGTGGKGDSGAAGGVFGASSGANGANGENGSGAGGGYHSNSGGQLAGNGGYGGQGQEYSSSPAFGLGGGGGGGGGTTSGVSDAAAGGGGGLYGGGGGGGAYTNDNSHVSSAAGSGADGLLIAIMTGAATAAGSGYMGVPF